MTSSARPMDDPGDDQRPLRPGPRDILRLVLPVFGATALVVAVGIVLILTHHRTLGTILVGIGAIGGFAVRAWLVWRTQQGPRSQP
jgi:hypothetical protein